MQVRFLKTFVNSNECCLFYSLSFRRNYGVKVVPIQSESRLSAKILRLNCVQPVKMSVLQKTKKLLHTNGSVLSITLSAIVRKNAICS